MKRFGPLPALAGGAVVVAALATWLVKGGWLMWVPVALALAAVGRVWHVLNR